MAEREMKVTQEQMAEARLDLAYRDYCAHLLIPLNRCRRRTVSAHFSFVRRLFSPCGGGSSFCGCQRLTIFVVCLAVRCGGGSFTRLGIASTKGTLTKRANTKSVSIF